MKPGMAGLLKHEQVCCSLAALIAYSSS